MIIHNYKPYPYSRSGLFSVEDWKKPYALPGGQPTKIERKRIIGETDTAYIALDGLLLFGN